MEVSQILHLEAAKAQNPLPLNQPNKIQNQKPAKTETEKREFKVNDIVTCEIPGKLLILEAEVRIWLGN